MVCSCVIHKGLTQITLMFLGVVGVDPSPEWESIVGAPGQSITVSSTTHYQVADAVLSDLLQPIVVALAQAPAPAPAPAPALGPPLAPAPVVVAPAIVALANASAFELSALGAAIGNAIGSSAASVAVAFSDCRCECL